MTQPIARTRTWGVALAAALVLGLTGASAAQAVDIQPALHPAQLDPASVIPWGIPGADPLRTDAADHCSGGPSAGAQNLLAFLEYWWPRGESDGIYNCRTIGSTSSYSLHAEGRAVDFHLDVNNDGDLAAGQAIRKWFIADDSSGVHYAMARRFGVQEIIFNKHIWTAARASEGWRVYDVPPGGDAHYTHIHIGINRPAANQNRTAWTGFHACRPRAGGCPPLD